MTDLKVVKFPSGNVQDIPAGLRNLADLIEHGALEGVSPGISDATRLAWVSVDESGNKAVGMLGGSFDRYALAGLLAAGLSEATG